MMTVPQVNQICQNIQDSQFDQHLSRTTYWHQSRSKWGEKLKVLFALYKDDEVLSVSLKEAVEVKD